MQGISLQLANDVKEEASQSSAATGSLRRRCPACHHHSMRLHETRPGAASAEARAAATAGGVAPAGRCRGGLSRCSFSTRSPKSPSGRSSSLLRLAPQPIGCQPILSVRSSNSNGCETMTLVSGISPTMPLTPTKQAICGRLAPECLAVALALDMVDCCRRPSSATGERMQPVTTLRCVSCLHRTAESRESEEKRKCARFCSQGRPSPKAQPAKATQP